ncbi:hypothetical protein ACH0B5_15320 [Ureibacillus sp. 179-F W5.1 NHS]|uniref:hypothetical protein n=1 Tax=Ureibacillus sp. 179-F W5.1 NHS TaxID=3374297 RepID=UPI003878FB71
MTLTLQEQLIKNGLAIKPMKKRKKKSKSQNFKEKLSKREIEALMGINRDIYKRVKGSFRKK